MTRPTGDGQADDEALTNEQIADAVNSSGFPLQLGLQRLIERSQDWRVSLIEHAWTDPLTNEPKFVDLVVSGKNRPFRLVVEAKRSRNTAWIFLKGRPGAGNRFEVQARAVSEDHSVDDWERVYFVPFSPTPKFCVVRKGGQYSQELIERTAAEVVRATEAMATLETAFSRRSRIRAGQLVAGLRGSEDDDVPKTRLYFPVIVTTARLYEATGDYEETDLAEGDLAEITGEEVSMVRFSKSLSALEPGPRYGKLEQLAQLADRTVLIVQAKHFAEFLEQWSLKLDSTTQSWLRNCPMTS